MYIEDQHKKDKSYVDIVNSVEDRLNSQIVTANFIVERVNKTTIA